MRILINEVWNAEGRTVELARIEANGNPRAAVYEWIRANRPDLDLATTIDAHGFHAVAVTS